MSTQVVFCSLAVFLSRNPKHFRSLAYGYDSVRFVQLTRLPRIRRDLRRHTDIITAWKLLSVQVIDNFGTRWRP